MILAAGRGERMRPLTDRCPKPLLTIRGKPLIVYHLEALRNAGIESVVINVSWLGELIVDALGDGTERGISILYSHEPQALETAGGIVHALDKLHDHFIVINADVFTDYDITRLFAVDKPAHLVLVNNPQHNPRGDFAIRDGLLSNGLDNRHTFSGIACYRRSFFADLKPGRRALAPLLTAAADSGDIGAELYTGAWSDVGTVDRLRQLNEPG